MNKTQGLNEAVLISAHRILDEWAGELTWELLSKEVNRKTGRQYSRVAIARGSELSAANAMARARLRGSQQ